MYAVSVTAGGPPPRTRSRTHVAHGTVCLGLRASALRSSPALLLGHLWMGREASGIIFYTRKATATACIIWLDRASRVAEIAAMSPIKPKEIIRHEPEGKAWNKKSMSNLKCLTSEDAS